MELLSAQLDHRNKSIIISERSVVIMQQLGSLYDDSFYHQHIKGMSQSAEIILKLLYQHYIPENVIDVGCGQGAWLRAAESLGSTVLSGFDGDWVNRNRLLSQTIDFHPIDFEQGFPESIDKYDLFISLYLEETFGTIP